MDGRARLYAFCAAHGVPHALPGKLLAAVTEAQLPALAALEQRALANGVADLRRLPAREAAALEPSLRCVAALLSPSTGLLDSHGLMQELLHQAEQGGGATLALRSRVVAGRLGAGGAAPGLHALEVEDAGGGGGGGGATRLTCRLLVNAAGLHAPRLSAALDGLPAASIPRQRLAKGSYFALSGGRPPFRHLIYPMPEPASPRGAGGGPPSGPAPLCPPSLAWALHYMAPMAPPPPPPPHIHTTPHHTTPHHPNHTSSPPVTLL